MSTITEEIYSLTTQTKLPLQGVVIFVSQQLASNRIVLHQQCTALGGKYVWVFDAPFTHYICQGKLSKRGKEYRKVIEYKALCVHPAWLKACHQFGQRVGEKLYATTYNPNRSLTFISAGDDDDEGDDDNDNQRDQENLIPSSMTTMKPTVSIKPIQTPRVMSAVDKKKKLPITASVPNMSISPPKTVSSLSQPLSQGSNEAETMLNDLESSLAQFLNNNTSSNNVLRPSITDDEQNKKSLQIFRSISNINNNTSHSSDPDIESSMRVEWLDDAMQAERKKMIDEDEHGISSQQQTLSGDSKHGLKRSLVDSNSNHSYNSKKIRT